MHMTAVTELYIESGAQCDFIKNAIFILKESLYYEVIQYFSKTTVPLIYQSHPSLYVMNTCV